MHFTQRIKFCIRKHAPIASCCDASTVNSDRRAMNSSFPKRALACSSHAPGIALLRALACSGRAPGIQFLRALLTAIAITAGGAAVASVYKCAGTGGIPVYQEVPCLPGRELRNFDADPPALSVIPGAEPGTAAPGSAAREKAPTTAEKKERARNDRGDAAERRHAHTGMSEGEVVAKLGRPDMTAGSGAKSKRRWTYFPAPGDPDTITTLYIDRGAVVAVDRKLMKR